MGEREHPRSHSEDASDNDLVVADDLQEVLAALQLLAEQTRHPVVRASLEQAHDDIVHLTSPGDEARADDAGDPAAAA
jgi:hypothetical protein